MNATDRQVTVVGAGITGLCTALAKEGLNVTIIERDAPPPAGGADSAFFEWNRRGAAQFRHPHAFLAVMCNLLKDSLPGLVDDIFAAGARKVTFEDMLPDDLKGVYSGFGIDLPKNTGRDVWELPMPARLVIDKEGIIRAIDADPDYTKRPEAEATLEVVRSL